MPSETQKTLSCRVMSYLEPCEEANIFNPLQEEAVSVPPLKMLSVALKCDEFCHPVLPVELHRHGGIRGCPIEVAGGDVQKQVHEATLIRWHSWQLVRHLF